MTEQSRNSHWLRLSFVLLSTLLPIATPLSASAQNAGASRFQIQHDEFLKDFQDGLARLIADCEKKSLAEAVEELLPWQAVVDVQSLSDRSLPRLVQADIPLTLPRDERQWRIEFRTLRQDLARDLYLLSRRVLNAGLPNATWRLIHEVVWYDSDYERARTLLGYERHGDEWVTPFAAKKLRGKFVWHARFGWLPGSHVERYDNGERFFRNHWQSAQKEAELRRDWTQAWEIETDNYLVKTNVGLEEGVELAKKLEVFHDWFQRSFPAFFNTPDQLKKLFAETTRRRRVARARFVIHYYRTKDEYVRQLIRNNPQIAITNGIYMPDTSIAHFYPDPDSDIESTIYHEATHQILYELDPRPRLIAEREHFWIIEGLACYMESFRPKAGGVSIGDPNYTRFFWAKHRLVTENFFIPLDRFAAHSKTAYQTPQQIHERYSQASGLVHFYMHYKSGLYRDALIDHVAALYRPLDPKFRIAGMDQFTGVSYETLGQQYRDYISALITVPVAAQVEAP
ncbi:MAG: DUF1570 domain-containing protein [Planctomycetota bacterium]|nr:DUF1570 domain-containing protein [Planctomycetota bacterium]